MMQKRTVYSLLLLSFILAFAVSSTFSQTVTIGDRGAKRCEAGVTTISVNHSADMSAVEVLLEVSSASGGGWITGLNVNWQIPASVLDYRVIDLSQANGISPDTIRIAALLIDSACLVGTGADELLATLDFVTNFSCNGEVLIGPLSTDYCGFAVETQIVECGGSTAISAAVTAGTITIQNVAPTIDPMSYAYVHWGALHQAQASGDDADSANGCENLTYGLISPPAGMSINPVTGLILWTPLGSQVCEHVIEVSITDSCGASATTSYTVCVQNTPPSITCPAEVTNIVWSETASGTVDAEDSLDSGPSIMQFALVSFNGPGTFNVDVNTGDWSWNTQEDNAYCGDFTAQISVTDGANLCDPCSPENADTCSLIIHVIPTIRVWIEKTHETPFGQYESVDIFLDDGIACAIEMGGFDFLIDYDASVLSFGSAVAGQMLDDCGWEYFTYQHGPTGCGGPCPSGKLRLTAFAETNNGAGNHPLCFIGTPGHLATMNFLVADNNLFECQYVPIRWCWYDCGDNGISSRLGDTLFISRHVFEFDTLLNSVPIEQDLPFPSLFGANSTCDTSGGPDKPEPLRLIDFYNGGIDIVCIDSIDDRGDINLNGISNEVADAVLFTNYFVYGLSVFTINPQGQIAATDVNLDGLVLSVADLVTLVRIVVGQQQPSGGKLSPVAVDLIHGTNGVLSTGNEVAIGALFVVVDGKASPELLADNMDMLYNFDGERTRIIVSSLKGNSFSGDVLNVRGEIISIEMATAEGAPVAAMAIIPSEFDLAQNYPNPFNPATNLSFTLPYESDYELAIFNVNGQKVHTFTGTANAGTVKLEWDASANASGIYFYKLTAGSFTATKKMVLLK